MNSPDDIDLDALLEPEPPSTGPPWRKYIPWLIVAGLAILFLPLYAIATTIGNDAARLEAELSDIQLELASEPTPLPEVQALGEEATRIQEQLSELEAIYSNLSVDHVDWPAAVAAIRNHDPNRITLTSLEQVDNRVLLNGRATDDTAVINYARTLEDSGQFARVIVQSISLTTPDATSIAALTPTQTVTPTAEASPTSATPQPTSSPTSDGRDEYEMDDVTPKPIFLGQLQSHNFFPTFDVDSVIFLAKAGRFYQVLTSNLTPGVDTFLTVTYGDIVLTNDDAKPGTLSSEIGFQMPADRDLEVTIQVSNRGQYGTEMSYQLFVQEVIPTAVPSPGPTNTPAPSATPTNPPPSATATPDLRDQYEPDDVDPNLIAVGEIQPHNFFPHSDVDKVSFLVKQNHHYQIATTNLALGVDTFMTVQQGAEEWENDDYAKPGSGNFASAVCFLAASDGLAVATISNLGQQFTPDKTYNISLAEVPELRTDKTQLVFGPVPSGGANPPSQNINLTGTGVINWTAETNVSWLTLTPENGATPTTLTVAANISSLSPGSYAGNITLAWATVCRKNITVTLQIDPASPLAPPETADAGADSAPASFTATRTAVSPRHMFNSKRSAWQRSLVEFVIVLELKTSQP